MNPQLKVNARKIVMLVVNDFTHDSRVLKEAKSALNNGYKVWVICRKSQATKFREEKDGIKIIRVQSFLDKLWQKTSKNTQEVAGSQSADAPKSLVTYAALINTWLINKLFVKQVLKIKPDIVHANDSTTLMAAYDLKKAGFPVVYDAHELYSESLEHPNPIWKKFFIYYEKNLLKLDGIFSVNQSILDEIDQRYKTKRLPKAILYNTPKYQENKPIKHKVTKLLYLGHNMAGRGLEELFEAIKYIPNVTLSVYGNGFTGKYHPRILINKPVPPEEVVEETKKYDIGILPYIGTNLNHIYSTPNKLFEYMMAGLAVAASDLPEIRRVIEKAQNGLVFNPKNPKDIALKIRSLIRSPKRVWEYKKNSLKFAKEYSWEEQEKRQIELYDKVIDKASVRSFTLGHPRVFVGPLDFGLNQLFKEEMEGLGFEVTTCSFVEHGKYGWKNDIELKINKVDRAEAIKRVLINFVKSLNYDIYHFKFGQSLLPWNLDLPILKVLGKKIVMNYHGLDIRQLDRFQRDKYNRLMVKKIEFNKFKELKKRIRHHWIKNWADFSAVSTPDLLEFAPEAEFIPEMANINKIQNLIVEVKNEKNKILILHAPSHRGIKGTEFVKKTVKKLREEKFKVELILAENIPAQEMPGYFQKADIVVDQLLIGAYGVVTIEGMLAGKPVICYIREDLYRYYPNDLPVFSANPANFYSVLRGLVENQFVREKGGQASLSYVNFHHNPETLGEKWKEIYISLGNK